MFAVLRKDLWFQFLPLAGGVLAALGLLAVLLVERIYTGQAVLPGLRLFVIVGLTPLAWLVVNRLLVQDGASQEGAQFLERLPIGRGRVLVLRTLVGGLLLASVFGVALGVIVVGAAALERDLPPAQITYIARQSSAFLVVVYAWLVASATLGRHRHATNAALLGGLLLAWRAGATPVGPFAYPWEDFQRQGGDALFSGLAMGGALLTGGLLLHRSRWGRRWQRPAGECDAMAVGAVAAIVLIAGTFTQRPVPFVLDGAIVTATTASGAQVRVRQAPGAKELARQLAADLERLANEQQLELPSVALDSCEALEVDGFERADLGTRSGLLVRASFTHPRTSLPLLRGRVLREAFDLACGGRLRHGAWALLLEGYPRFLIPAGPGRREQESLRVAWALARLQGAGLDAPASVQRWPEVRGLLGDPVAESLAGWLLARLAEATTPQSVHDLVRSARAERDALGGGWGDGSQALARSLAPHRASWDSLLALRTRELLTQHAAKLASLPRAAEGSQVELLADGTLRFEAGTAGAPGRLALLHAQTRFDSPVPLLYDREEVPGGAGPLQTTRRYPAGARILWALARYVPELGCDVLLHPWRRVGSS